jgi:hypothetical protein
MYGIGTVVMAYVPLVDTPPVHSSLDHSSPALIFFLCLCLFLCALVGFVWFCVFSLLCVLKYNTQFTYITQATIHIC